jgi:anti-anti-sigma factor
VTEQFKCTAEWVGAGSAVMTIVGDLDMATAEEASEVLHALSEPGITGSLAVDLTRCTFIDSVGLSVLIYAQKVTKGPLHVASDNERIRRLLGVTHLDEVFMLHHTRAEALAALEEQD